MSSKRTAWVWRSELSWAIFAVRLPSTPGAPPTEQQRIAETSIKRLRTLLRQTPRWIRGHLLLAGYCLTQFKVASDRLSRRELATAELSARAALALLGEGASRRRQARAKLILAQVAHYNRDYEKALLLFSELTPPELQLGLTDSESALAFEYSGAAAMALGDYQAARKFFDAVPDALRSAEVDQGLRFLDARGQAGFDGATTRPPAAPHKR